MSSTLDSLSQGQNYNTQFIHPFKMVLAGSSGSGKTTFCSQLLLRMRDLISVEFEYIVIFIGTKKSENKIVQLLTRVYPEKIRVVEIKSLYPDKTFVSKFATDFPKFLIPGKIGCVIFDDLMVELAESEILVPLFTKISAHREISCIHITQNIFYKGGGKRAGDNVTIYRNTNYLVLFNNKMDNHVFEVVARRLKTGSYKYVSSMFETIADEHRYILIDGQLSTPSELKYRTDIFGMAKGYIPYQRVIILD